MSILPTSKVWKVNGVHNWSNIKVSNKSKLPIRFGASVDNGTTGIQRANQRLCQHPGSVIESYRWHLSQTSDGFVCVSGVHHVWPQVTAPVPLQVWQHLCVDHVIDSTLVGCVSFTRSIYVKPTTYTDSSVANILCWWLLFSWQLKCSHVKL